MIDFHKSSASMRPKQYPLLAQALLRSFATTKNPEEMQLRGKKLATWLESFLGMPFKVVDYNECSWSSTWCRYQTTNLPSPANLPINIATQWKVPRPTTVVTEFDTYNDPRVPDLAIIAPDPLNRQRLDAIRLWRFLFCCILGEAPVPRAQLNNAPSYFMEALYSRIRGQHEHAGSHRLNFNWCGQKGSAQVGTDSSNMLANAVASIWPGMGTCTVTEHCRMPTNQAAHTSLNGLYAMNKVLSVPREMYGLTVVSKQLSTGEVNLIAAFLLTSCILHQYYMAENTWHGDTSVATKNAMQCMQQFTRTVVNDFTATAGKLSAFAPKTFNLD